MIYKVEDILEKMKVSNCAWDLRSLFLILPKISILYAVK